MTTSKQNQLSREEKMLRGTAWATISDFISRLLGAFYIIPWYIWMGQAAPQANALFSMGYTIYATFLSISTVGLNVGVAKQVAKYNAIGQEEKGLALTRTFLKVMGITGAIFALILYVGAPFFSATSGAGQELVPILRSLTLAVLVFPAMSVLRGLFQGYNNIRPSAIATMAEQLIRVIWMLLTTFYIMKLGSGDYIKAVTQSTFAAFVGMLACILVLLFYLQKEGLLTKLFTSGTTDKNQKESFSLLTETVKSAIPFIITGSALQLYQLVDQGSFINIMSQLTDYSTERLTIMYSYLSANPNKIIMIIVAIAASIGAIGIALLTDSYMQEDKRGTARLILNNFQMLMTFLFPALTGAIILARPLYSFFYGASEDLAISLFIAILLQTFLQAFYVMLSPMLHAVFESKKAIQFFIYGLMAKAVLQLPSLYLFKEYGPVISTAIGLLIPVVLMYRHLHRATRFNHRIIVKNFIQTSKQTIMMAVPVALVAWGMTFFLSPDSRFGSVIYLAVGALVGVTIYGYLALKTRSIDKLLGQRAANLRRKFKIN